MKKKDAFEQWLRSKPDLDVFEPEEGHFERFQARLKSQKKKSVVIRWQWLAVAATLLLMLSVWFGRMDDKKGLDLADISPKMEETQDFFVQTIRKEIKQIEKIKNPDNQKIIDDALTQLDKLEVEYKKLKLELKYSGENQLVIFAMISNYQKRIEILQNLMETLQEIDKVKQNKQIS